MPKQVWVCDWCGGTFPTKDWTESHESECSYNPAMRTCDSCKAFDENSRHVDEPFCCKMVKGHVDIYFEDMECPEWEDKRS